MLPFIRSILLILLIFFLWQLFKILQRRSKKLKKQQDTIVPKSPPETLLRCAHCGTHIPKKEAVYSEDGRVFCCSAHKAATE